ncbi:hypothetical protein [Mycolicibacter heraklionensis]|uniref:hypothetical protein n=1 Tax=Mycolicibacter heraklionensis TaxID=512402 RepID=UPI00069C291F|nr:hypothetical protein [Mycolicibacter heraklionensis]
MTDQRDERLIAAEQLLKDGSGYREAARTVHVSRGQLAQMFPGYGLSLADSARRARLARDFNAALRDAHTQRAAHD